MRVSRVLCPETQSKIVHSRINGYDLLVLANEDVGRSIHYFGRYEPAETRYLAKEINPEAVCVDIGANVGYFTLLMAQAASRGIVHAFEPLPLNAALLRASIELNGFKNIRLNQCALGNNVGTVSFSQPSDSAFSSMRDTSRKPLERVFNITITTLDEYLDRADVKRVDVLKADVEGAEGLVVEGSSKLLIDKTRRPRIIMLELFEQNLRPFGASVSRVIEDMENFGYKPFVLNGEDRMVPFTNELQKHYYNVFFCPTRI